MDGSEGVRCVCSAGKVEGLVEDTGIVFALRGCALKVALSRDVRASRSMGGRRGSPAVCSGEWILREGGRGWGGGAILMMGDVPLLVRRWLGR